MLNPDYAAHIQTLLARYAEALEATGFDAVVLPSGYLSYYYADDHAHPFHASATAQQWLPFRLPPQVHVVIRPDRQPLLIWPGERDFWHSSNPLPDGDWQTQWSLRIATSADDLKSCFEEALQSATNTAWVGPPAPQLTLTGVMDNPANLIQHLNFQRAIKTDYEVRCHMDASQWGVRGHLAAREAFISGSSEAQIYQAFLNASQQLSVNEPYPGIVGLNEHAATLHYEKKSWQTPDIHRTLLIDAGADCQGYASDITRTWLHPDAGAESSLFSALLGALEQLQLALCRRAVAGVEYTDLHGETLTGIAIILQESGICRLPVEEQLHKQVPQAFFPHGLGHLLGLQVHDVGGFQQDTAGSTRQAPDNAPFLRLTRTLETNMVVTIEPGLYFIPMLLERLVNQQKEHGCDLPLISQLRPFGGIRIEDNILIGDGESRNLTREAWTQLAS